MYLELKRQRMRSFNKMLYAESVRSHQCWPLCQRLSVAISCVSGHSVRTISTPKLIGQFWIVSILNAVTQFHRHPQNSVCLSKWSKRTPRCNRKLIHSTIGASENMWAQMATTTVPRANYAMATVTTLVAMTVNAMTFPVAATAFLPCSSSAVHLLALNIAYCYSPHSSAGEPHWPSPTAHSQSLLQVLSVNVPFWDG